MSCDHPETARRTRVVRVRGYRTPTSYCTVCQKEKQKSRRAMLQGRLLGINEYLNLFAKLPVIHG